VDENRKRVLGDHGRDSSEPSHANGRWFVRRAARTQIGWLPRVFSGRSGSWRRLMVFFPIAA